MFYILIFFILINYINAEFEILPTSKIYTINNGLCYLDIISNYTYIQVDNIIYNLQNNTSIQLDNFGEFEIFYSSDNSIFYPSNYYVYNYQYINLNNNNITFSNSLGDTSTDSLSTNKISLWIVVAGILTAFFVLSIILILRIYYPYKVESFLYYIDHLYLNIYNDIPISDSHTTQEIIKLGIGVKINQRTTVLGGILTILIFVVSIFAITSYFYDTLSNNLQIISTFSINNNNIIPLESSNLDIQITLKDLLYGKCNTCNDWNLGLTNLPIGELHCYDNPIISNFSSDCIIEYSCTNCAIDVGTDVSFSLTQSLPNIGYKYLKYIVQTNSYNGISTISGNITTNSIFTGNNPNIISLSIIPTSYTNEYGSKSTGYVLDYQNSILGSTYNITKYAESNTNSTVGVNIKINRNPSWYNIIVSVKYTTLVIFSQLFAIISGIFTISRATYNIISVKLIRKLLYRCLHKKVENTEIA